MDKPLNTGTNKEKDSFKNAPQTPISGTSDRSAERSSTSGVSTNVGSSFGDAKNAIKEQARPAVDYVKSNLEPVFENSQVYFEDAKTIIKRHPFYSIAGAAAIGAFVGMMFSRPSRSI